MFKYDEEDEAMLGCCTDQEAGFYSISDSSLTNQFRSTPSSIPSIVRHIDATTQKDNDAFDAFLAELRQLDIQQAQLLRRIRPDVVRQLI